MRPAEILIAGNWKMNGTHASAAAFVEALSARGPLARPGRALLVCPPATLIASLSAPLRALGVGVGAQDCHAEPRGAFTGDIAAAMIADLGAGHVIVGHSERRFGHGETDGLVRTKASAALDSGLVPIICVGESWAEREAGQAETVVREQVMASVPDGIAAGALVVAYEPIWAIGSGRAATLDDIAAMHAVIREAFAGKSAGGHGRILYGGSVKPGNAAGILGLDGVDGALIGGASLDAGDFLAIADAAPA
jgi:triosephosphate isomerase